MNTGPSDDPRWLQTSEADTTLKAQIEQHYPLLVDVKAHLAYSSVHDMIEIVSEGSRYALKMYRPGARTREDIEWEVGLHHHLFTSGVPVMSLIEGRSGFVEQLQFEDQPRTAVMSRWAPGTKPTASQETYQLLGRAAASIHVAADTYAPAMSRREADFQTEASEKLECLRPLLQEFNRWHEVQELADRLERFIAERPLERGVCHNDLTLDNVHIDDEEIFVFDFDSASVHWRAWESQAVFHSGALKGDGRWNWWRAGYTSIRELSANDGAAVPWFALMSQFENTAWKLGLLPTSVHPYLQPDQLPGIVDSWLTWSDAHCHGIT